MTNRTDNVLIEKGRGLRFTESPRWHDGKFWFLDIHDRRIKSADLDGNLETVLELTFIPNGFGVCPDGSLIFSDALQRHVYRWDGSALTRLADLSSMTVFV